ncbi:hypothetical protein KJ877_06770 [bacterium]|nr:hypothetical protein [bacterium]MBU1991345.1 hypothetical protein [bacterium]
MNKKTDSLLYIFAGLALLLIIETLYIKAGTYATNAAMLKKSIFVELCGLPELAISNETPYIRHRSLSAVAAIYQDDPILREYEKTSFSISHSYITPSTKSRDDQ